MGVGRRQEDTFYTPNGTSEEMLSAAASLAQKSLSESKELVGLPVAPVILYVGHFDPVDDVMFFARCAAPVAARFNATIAVVGDGPELSRVKRFFEKYGQARSHFFGQLSHEQYLKVVAAADVATFPYPDNAVYRAKCSARIIDFMAAGKAILSSAVGQNPEYIINGESGVLTCAGDEQEYRTALERLLSDQDLRHRLGRTARDTVQKTFLWSGMSTNNCMKAYQAAVRHSGSQSRVITALTGRD
jgi:glycosyltransferase involved in cell wall biosynthesis